MLPPRLRKIKNKRMVVVLAVSAPVLIWMGAGQLWGPAQRPMAVTGTIQAREIPVASKIGGRVESVKVQEGQLVHPGQVLVEFEVPELKAQRNQLKSEVLLAKARLAELENGPRTAEIDAARARAEEAEAHWIMKVNGFRKGDVQKSVARRKELEEQLELLKKGYRKEEISQAKALMKKAKAELEWAEKDYARFKTLSEEGAVSRRDADQLEAKVDQAREAFTAANEKYSQLAAGPRQDEIDAARQRLNAARYEEAKLSSGYRQEEIEMARQNFMQAKANLKLLTEGTRPEQIAQAEAKLKQTEARLAELEARLQDRKVASPCQAEVSVMDIHKGEVIPSNRTVATLTRLDEVWTRVYLPERELGRVRVGQKVTVKADAYPDKTFRGKIVQIPGVAEFTPRNVQTPEERSGQVFGLKVRIDNEERLLRGGMNADVTLPPVKGVCAWLAQGK